MVICLTKQLLNEKHHFAKIWLAAHWEKKIKKSQIFEVDIVKSIQEIMDAQIIFDLRISGHLLVGIVKIHSKKTKYLLNECNSIFYQVKIFHTGEIDLPVNKMTAAVDDITLGEFFDNIVIENDVIEAIMTNQCHIEDITLKETNKRLTAFDETDMVDFEFHEEDGPFDNFDDDLLSLIEKEPEDLNALMKRKKNAVNQRGKKPRYLSVTSEEIIYVQQNCNDKDQFDLNSEENPQEIPENSSDSNCQLEIPESIEMPTSIDDNRDNYNKLSMHKNIEKLNLEPLKIPTKRASKIRKSKKRKLSVDYIKSMSHEDIKNQVLDTSDITSILLLAPASKRLMSLKEIGCAEMLLCLPATKLLNSKLLKLYKRNLKSHECDRFDSFSEEEDEALQLPRKRAKNDSVKEIMVDETSPKSINASLNNENGSIAENDVPLYDENFMVDNEFENVPLDPIPAQRNEGLGQLSPDIPLENNSILAKDTTGIQSTQISKTSEEKWQYALQDRIIQVLQYLKPQFERKSVISFSSLCKNNKRLWVAQKFLCLLMLKKFQVISLEQSGSFEEIHLTPDLNFESACLKYCCS